MLIVLEGMSYSEAIHLCVITGKVHNGCLLFQTDSCTYQLIRKSKCFASLNPGTTIGYGDVTPSSDLGRFSLVRSRGDAFASYLSCTVC